MEEVSVPRSGNDAIEARYANVFQVGFNALEFVIDAGQRYGEGPEFAPNSRIVTGPWYAAQLLRVLQESIREYESQFGAIEER